MSSTFKVYVAASAAPSESARVVDAIAMLHSRDIVVTCTWPEVVAATPGGSNPRDASTTDRCRWSTQDLIEIDAADAVWFLVPTLPTTTRGAWFESGYAHATGKHLVFSGDTVQSVFCAMGHEFADDADALEFLVMLARMPQPVATFNDIDGDILEVLR